MPAEYTSTIPAIPEVLSRPQDNIALVYSNSNDNTYNAIAFQITQAVRRIERAENVLTLADGETQEFGYVGEDGFSSEVTSPGDEIFRVDADRDHTIVEYGFAVPQDGVYIGLETGGGDPINGYAEGSDRDRGYGPDDLPDSGVLSDHTYVDAPPATNDEPIPTTALSETLEHGLIRADSKQQGDNPFFFAFKNESGGQVDIDITGFGRTYNVRPITNEETVRSMVTGDINRKLVNYGGLGNTNPNLPRSWYDHRIRVGPGELTP